MAHAEDHSRDPLGFARFLERRVRDTATSAENRAVTKRASSRGASQPAAVAWAEKFRLLLDRNRPTTYRLAADGRWYTWQEFAVYYRDDARAMWKAAWHREVGKAIWFRVVSMRWRTFACRMADSNLKRCLSCIWWRSFACRMANWRDWCRGAVLRQLVDKRIGARRTDPWDEPTARVVTDRNPWDDYEEEFEEEFDAEQEESGFSDTIERWGDYVFTDLMDAEGALG